MSDNNSTLVPADNGEATPPPSKKPSIRARLKARRQKFETEHPLRSACVDEALKGGDLRGRRLRTPRRPGRPDVARKQRLRRRDR